MKWVRTIILFDKGGLACTAEWKDIHASYVKAISAIDNPVGSGQLTLRRKTFTRSLTGKIKWKRNGVTYLRQHFLKHLTDCGKWKPESEVDLAQLKDEPKLQLYPSFEEYQEPVTSSFGDFDFVTTTENGFRVALEWETGNISSSHRSLNKLSIVLAREKITAGVLIVPTRALYEHLTDRIGNINELSPYLGMWRSMGDTVKRGLLAVTVVEHDHLTDDSACDYLKVGTDGRALERQLDEE